MKKRYRAKPLKPGQLSAYYGKSEDGDIDLVYCNGGGGSSRADARLLCNFMEAMTYDCGTGEKNLRKHLEERGYDITTLKFSIQQKAEGR